MAKRADRKQTILVAARTLFSQRGYHGVSLGDIAHEAGLSVGLIYYVFPKKEDILLGVVKEASLLYREVFQKIKDIDDPIARIDALMRDLYEELDNGSRILMILYKDLSTIDKETRQQILELERETKAKIVDIIDEGKQNGIFKQAVSSELVAFNLIGIGHLWALKKSWLFGEMPLERFVEEQQQLVHSMLLM
ncbi:TetR/AcrR family transcriptional regulator [Alicyclobacillus fastidiosus]|uniref:TetR/AcrR family transcriptional regulator n=1 Tax=Alicyclobacillus fastidiosus TaxID=392011 RepID=A0ABY6ZH09_9BACL|nr:TetR/AcrR family transcriptional regulator [Alicyclobacillus fastidiosus]WAH42010.1 TetR/AcrR family transcriptional regulator [Alicyclobacillus fastidiosus]GMA63751.1 TetR family transcriptional regulator [Alicyclobacillus fastidiosus]